MNSGKKRPARAERIARPFAGVPERLESRQLLSACVASVASPNFSVQPAATTATVAGYTPAQIRTAYGLNQVSGTGAGQTIAIIDAFNDPNIASDLATFDAHFGIAAPPSLKVVSRNGGSVSGIPTDPGWAGEISLDVEWAHAIAPGANILLVEAKDDSLTNLLSSVNYARNAVGVSVVSMSWGGGEFSGQTSYDSYFTTPKGHSGVTFVAASGDDGSRSGVEWPASSPNVLSVGGTTLIVNGSSGTYSKEAPWNDSTGGDSRYEREPAFQRDAQRTGVRTVPDVSFDADPTTGYAVYDSIPYDGSKGWQVYGGTSAGAPQWSAMIAICDQARVAAKLGTLDGSSQTLPALYQPYETSTTYSAVYHDVTGLARSWFGGMSVTDAGYDPQTGLGTPKGPGAAHALETTTVTTTSTESTGGSATVSISRPAFVGPNGQPSLLIGPGPAVAAPPPFASAPGSSTQGSLGQGSSQLAAIFNDTLIHRGAAVASIGATPVNLGDWSMTQTFAISAPATVAGWMGEVDAGLVAWLMGNESAQGGGTSAPTVVTSGAAMGAIENSAPTIAHAAVALTTAVGAPAIAVPANIIYRFANFDPVGTFADAMTDFAKESASMTPMATATQHQNNRAWWITGAVLGVDAILAAKWYVDRSAASRKQKKQSSASSPQSPQTGILPAGL